MNVCRKGLLILLLGLLATAGLPFLLPSACGQPSPKDLTDIDPEKVGFKPVQVKKDPKTGFLVGGKNPTALLKDLAELNGRTIEALEKDMRAGGEGRGGIREGIHRCG